MKNTLLILLISMGINASASENVSDIPLESHNSSTDFSHLLDEATQIPSSYLSCSGDCFNQFRECTRNNWPEHCVYELEYCLAECTPNNLPDVVVTDVWTEPANPKAGVTRVTFHATICNQGNASTPAGVSVGTGFSVNGSGTGSAFFVRDAFTYQARPLAANECYTGQGNLTWTPPTVNTYTIRAWADDINRFQESNENNNKNYTTVTAQPPF